MGMLEDHKIELAVAEAFENSADARALALVQIAVDPAGTKAQLDELLAAARAHDEARATAEAALAAAEAKSAATDIAAAALEKRIAEQQLWIDPAQKHAAARCL